MDNEHDLSNDETYPPPNCDDCGGFEIKKHDGEKWVCPVCFPKEVEDDE
jgi:hypothetical protein